MKTDFLGQSGQNTFTVTQQVADGSSLDAQRDIGLQSSAAITGVPGVQSVQMSAGRSGSALQAAFLGGGGATTIRYSITTDEGADQDALQQQVRDALATISDPDGITIGAGGRIRREHRDRGGHHGGLRAGPDDGRRHPGDRPDCAT